MHMDHTVYLIFKICSSWIGASALLTVFYSILQNRLRAKGLTLFVVRADDARLVSPSLSTVRPMVPSLRITLND